MAKKRRVAQRILIGLSFLFFSAIVVINNTTQLLETFGIPMSSRTLFLVGILGLFGSAVWGIVLAAMGEFS